MDRWGLCGQCTRWFYMTTTHDRCPVCQREAARIEYRDVDGAHVEDDALDVETT